MLLLLFISYCHVQNGVTIIILCIDQLFHFRHQNLQSPKLAMFNAQMQGVEASTHLLPSSQRSLSYKLLQHLVPALYGRKMDRVPALRVAGQAHIWCFNDQLFRDLHIALC